METIYKPEMNDGKHILVFGSNLPGRHGAGAAWVARKHWGAVNGVGTGPEGQSYAIPTKDQRLDVIPLARINLSVQQFLTYARKHPDLTFLVTRIGCGLAGYKDEQIGPMFQGAPGNCVLPKEWLKPPPRT